MDYPPEVVDANGSPVLNQSEIYSGIYAFVNVTFFPYAFGGKKGIGCGLGPVMKRRDGEPLGGGRMSAAQAFGALPASPESAAPLPAASSYGFTSPAAGAVNPITGLPF